MTKGIIYRITSLKRNFDYVGSTVKFANRINVHRYYLRKIYGENTLNDFDILILEEMEYSNKSELREREKEYIRILRPNQNKYLVK